MGGHGSGRADLHVTEQPSPLVTFPSSHSPPDRSSRRRRSARRRTRWSRPSPRRVAVVTLLADVDVVVAACSKRQPTEHRRADGVPSSHCSRPSLTALPHCSLRRPLVRAAVAVRRVAVVALLDALDDAVAATVPAAGRGRTHRPASVLPSSHCSPAPVVPSPQVPSISQVDAHPCRSWCRRRRIARRLRRCRRHRPLRWTGTRRSSTKSRIRALTSSRQRRRCEPPDRRGRAQWGRRRGSDVEPHVAALLPA